jgi:hypothetical protein
MNDNPEIRAKVLEWQRRHNIQDNDPALALIELLDIYYRKPLENEAAAASGLSPAALQTALQPAVDRLSAQMRDLAGSAQAGGPALSADALADALRAPLQAELTRLSADLKEAVRQPPVAISSDALAEAIKVSLLPSIDRMTFQVQELQKRLETSGLEETTKKIETFNENIEFCTKKLDVVKKESDALVVKLEKASAEIKPITRGAVVMLMAVTGLIGYVLAYILR